MMMSSHEIVVVQQTTDTVQNGNGPTTYPIMRVFRFEFDSDDAVQVAIDALADMPGHVHCEFLSGRSYEQGRIDAITEIAEG